MYFNVLGEKVSRARYRQMLEAAKTRRELIAARLTSRRDLLKMGLLTAGGMLVAKSGLSARASSFQDQTGGSNNLCVPSEQAASPPTRSFVDPLPIMPPATPVRTLNPFPTLSPNTAAGESRTRDHQMFNRFIQGATFYNVTQHAINVTQSPDLPVQTIWGFDDGVHATSPGPTYVNFYGKPVLVRNNNALPPVTQNGGFGIPSVSTHLHNGHTPSESDGFPCDFFEIGHFYDQQYPNVLAGFNSDHIDTNGDINEALSTLWYHDHRVDFTSQSTYKGLLGFYLLFNQFDTGNEHTGFRLPSYPQFDIPLLFADKVYDPTTGLLAFDLFNLDGILGDKFLVNGKIQPFFQVQPRRYRFRLLDTGPSRFYEFFLTDLNNLNAVNTYWFIGSDGNLAPAPVQIQSIRIGPAERVEVIIDFSKFAGKSIYLENRLNQINGQGPVINSECGLPEILPAGQGNLLLRFDVSSGRVDDDSGDPAEQTFYQLPSTTPTPRLIRTFKFDRLNGQWSINGQFMDCNEIRVHVQPNSSEHWILTNLTGDSTHPVHIHLEEHQILSRNGAPPPATERSRKDVVQLHPNERVELFFRFRDWTGRYPLHCHNVVHEDHAMMLRWEVDPNGGDNTLVP
ncbi:MAG TPA: multicopper oxidase domain-containing protein [Blastocatellia bacterium]|nr:multicopper oxidase domain-containing protein [Blastocatellia bacterium]